MYKKILAAALLTAFAIVPATAVETNIRTATVVLPGNPVAEEKINNEMGNLQVQAQQQVFDAKTYCGPLAEDSYFRLNVQSTYRDAERLSFLVEWENGLYGDMTYSLIGYVFSGQTGDMVPLTAYFNDDERAQMEYITAALRARGIGYDEGLAEFMAENGGHNNYYLDYAGRPVMIFQPGELIDPDMPYTEIIYEP